MALKLGRPLRPVVPKTFMACSNLVCSSGDQYMRLGAAGDAAGARNGAGAMRCTMGTTAAAMPPGCGSGSAGDDDDGARAWGGMGCGGGSGGSVGSGRVDTMGVAAGSGGRGGSCGGGSCGGGSCGGGTDVAGTAVARTLGRTSDIGAVANGACGALAATAGATSDTACAALVPSVTAGVEIGSGAAGSSGAC